MTLSYRDLVAWNKAMELVTRVYQLTQGFPKEEKFSLVSQLRRSAVSIPSNIAEGQGRLSNEGIPAIFGSGQGIAGRIGNADYDCSKSELPQ